MINYESENKLIKIIKEYVSNYIQFPEDDMYRIFISRPFLIDLIDSPKNNPNFENVFEKLKEYRYEQELIKLQKDFQEGYISSENYNYYLELLNAEYGRMLVNYNNSAKTVGIPKKIIKKKK